jgi:lipopolysaccharide export system protein LptC
MNARTLTGLIILLAAAVGSWYLAASLTPAETIKTPSSNLHDGFYLRSARMLGTDENGQLLYEIEAEYAEQLDELEVEFKNVQIRYAVDANVPWSLNADSAILADGERRLKLRGHVTALSEQGFSGEVTEIRTDYLEFEPDTFLAETDERVQIRIGARSLTATGMLALLEDNRLQLKSNVSGKFVP